jgi:hypothetical protein
MGRSYAPVQFPLSDLQERILKILTLSEHEKGKIVCPHCKSKDVEQRWAAFYAVTSKKG